ncbi:MAG TPA: hypothetical protein VJ938_14720 [Acidimicrobiia bacterium]|nr:hypothetical protein [Acidimicrobiia bacterium]
MPGGRSHRYRLRPDRRRDGDGRRRHDDNIDNSLHDHDHTAAHHDPATRDPAHDDDIADHNHDTIYDYVFVDDRDHLARNFQPHHGPAHDVHDAGGEDEPHGHLIDHAPHPRSGRGGRHRGLRVRAAGAPSRRQLDPGDGGRDTSSGVVPTGISTLGAVLLVVLAGAVAAGAFALIRLLR